MVRLAIGRFTPIINRGALHRSFKEKNSKPGGGPHMKKFLICVFLGVFVFVVYSAENNGIVKNQKEWSTNGISVIAGCEKNEFSIADKIELKITILNKSQENIFIVFTHPFNMQKITIINKKNNQLIHFSEFGKQLRYDEGFRDIEEIKKNDSYTYNLNLREYFDLSLDSEYSVNIEGKYLDKTKKKFTSYKIENLTFSINKNGKIAGSE